MKYVPSILFVVFLILFFAGEQLADVIGAFRLNPPQPRDPEPNPVDVAYVGHTALINELTSLAVWVRSGDGYDVADARDEIARAIENRVREVEAHPPVFLCKRKAPHVCGVNGPCNGFPRL